MANPQIYYVSPSGNYIQIGWTEDGLVYTNKVIEYSTDGSVWKKATEGSTAAPPSDPAPFRFDWDVGKDENLSSFTNAWVRVRFDDVIIQNNHAFLTHGNEWTFGENQEFPSFITALVSLLDYMRGSELPETQFFLGAKNSEDPDGKHRFNFNPMDRVWPLVTAEGKSIVISSINKSDRVKLSGGQILPSNTLLKIDDDLKVWKTDWLIDKIDSNLKTTFVLENETALEESSSLEECQDKAGSYFFNFQTKELYIHASDGSRARTNGYEYEVGVASHIFWWEPTDDSTDMYDVVFMDLDFYDSVKHALRFAPPECNNTQATFVTKGFKFIGCRFIGTGGAIHLEWNEDTSIEDCFIYRRPNDANPGVHHIAATIFQTHSNAWRGQVWFDGNVATAYNFPLEWAQGTGGRLEYNTRPIHIGKIQGEADGSVGDGLHGYVTDVRIYNRKLSSEEVRLIYQGCSITDGLVGHWDFTGVVGTNVPDLSPTGNDATLVGTAQVVSGLRGMSVYLDESGMGWVEIPHNDAYDSIDITFMAMVSVLNEGPTRILSKKESWGSQTGWDLNLGHDIDNNNGGISTYFGSNGSFRAVFASTRGLGVRFITGSNVDWFRLMHPVGTQSFKRIAAELWDGNDTFLRITESENTDLIVDQCYISGFQYGIVEDGINNTVRNCIFRQRGNKYAGSFGIHTLGDGEINIIGNAFLGFSDDDYAILNDNKENVIIKHNTFHDDHLRGNNGHIEYNVGNASIEFKENLVSLRGNTGLFGGVPPGYPDPTSRDLSDYGWVQSPHTGYWYKVKHDELSQGDHELSVNQLGGHLASIESIEENTWLSVDALEGSSPYIGAHYNGSEFFWYDGTPWGFTSWGSGEPNNLPSEDGVRLFGADEGIFNQGEWNNITSTFETLGLMQIKDPSTLTPENWDTIELEFYGWKYRQEDGLWYKLSTSGSKTYSEHKAQATKMGAYLATVESIEVNDFLTDVVGVGTSPAYIGWKTDQTEWEDGTTQTYTNWYPGQPDGPSGQAVVLNHITHRWYDTDDGDNTYAYFQLDSSVLDVEYLSYIRSEFKSAPYEPRTEDFDLNVYVGTESARWSSIQPNESDWKSYGFDPNSRFISKYDLPFGTPYTESRHFSAIDILPVSTLCKRVRPRTEFDSHELDIRLQPYGCNVDAGCIQSWMQHSSDRHVRVESGLWPPQWMRRIPFTEEFKVDWNKITTSQNRQFTMSCPV